MFSAFQEWVHEWPYLSWCLMLAAYVGVARVSVRRGGQWGKVCFASANLIACFGLIYSKASALHGSTWMILGAAYLGVVVGHWWVLARWGMVSGWKGWLGPLMPISVLILIRCLPQLGAWLNSVLPTGWALADPPERWGQLFLGFSYLAFRTTSLAVEVRNEKVPMPDLWEYLGFAFFAPTLQVGPISPFSVHRKGQSAEVRAQMSVDVALLRILVGATKALFLGALLWKLSYRQLLRDGYPHGWIDVPIAMVAYYLFLYCNFSGFCDAAIGVAGLIGIPVAENFDQPFRARNIKEFWNRWHMTLSGFMRDFVFVPLSKELIRRWGPARANDAMVIAILVVFLLIGIWHGAGWNYAAYGAVHAVGVAANHYYTLWLKAGLGKVRFKAYMESRWIEAAAVAATFAYVAASMALFANDTATLWQLFQNFFFR